MFVVGVGVGVGDGGCVGGGVGCGGGCGGGSGGGVGDGVGVGGIGSGCCGYGGRDVCGASFSHGGPYIGNFGILFIVVDLGGGTEVVGVNISKSMSARLLLVIPWLVLIRVWLLVVVCGCLWY